MLAKNHYEGEWANGKRHGRGTTHFADGIKYIGDYVNDKMTGQGVHTWSNGDRYELRCSQTSRHH
jgi:hypothetical protein